MAKFITINDYEMLNAEHIVGFRLNPARDGEDPKINGKVSITISLINNTCVTMYDYRRIKRFFSDMFYLIPECTQPEAYSKMYEEFLIMIGEKEDKRW